MARRPRTTFAAPLVLVAACSHDAGRGGGGPRALERWSVEHKGDRCIAHEHVECPPDGTATCNPPMPLEYACPGFPAASAAVVTSDGKTCTIDGTQTAVACPHNDPPPPPPPDAAPAPHLRTWNVHIDGKNCVAWMNVECPRGPNGEIPPCNPPAPQKVACDLPDGSTIRENAPDTCVVIMPPSPCPPGAMCNPPPPLDVACPKW